MACCRSSRDEAGYATPAALVLCLALALVAAAMVGRSVAILRLARSDLEMTQTAYALDGAHLAAAAAVVRTAQKGPYHWTFTTDLGWVEAWAEPERDKLSLSNALDDELLAAFGVGDAAMLRGRMQAAAQGGQALPPDIAGMDAAPAWRKCAPSVISFYGEAQAPPVAPTAVPRTGPGPEPQSWRIGEPWRIAVATATGWRDERIVRFTGDASRPVAVVTRRLRRESGDGGLCEAVMRSLARP